MRPDLEMLKGAIDMHVHSSPDLQPRLVDHVELAQMAREAGYRAVVLKSQNMGSADRAPFIRMLVPGIDIFGSITLNYSVGGINPFAVNAGIGFGAKIVWMPTIDARHHADFFGSPGGFGGPNDHFPEFYRKAKGISVISDDGKLLPEVLEILDLVAANNVALGLGHTSIEEMFALAKGCQDVGVKKMFVDHPDIGFTKVPRDSQVELAKMGVKMNYVAAQLSPAFYCITPQELAKNIRAVGVQNTLISTDVGQPANPNPIEMMRSYVQILFMQGFTTDDVKTMLHDNPAAYLYE